MFQRLLEKMLSSCLSKVKWEICRHFGAVRRVLWVERPVRTKVWGKRERGVLEECRSFRVAEHKE